KRNLLVDTLSQKDLTAATTRTQSLLLETCLKEGVFPQLIAIAIALTLPPTDTDTDIVQREYQPRMSFDWSIILAQSKLKTLETSHRGCTRSDNKPRKTLRNRKSASGNRKLVDLASGPYEIIEVMLIDTTSQTLFVSTQSFLQTNYAALPTQSRSRASKKIHHHRLK
ncbi:uncharacterized protein N7482_010755, partial [Penicillium canariense]